MHYGEDKMSDSQQRKPERSASFTVKSGLAQMLKGGVIMDVSRPISGPRAA